MFGAGWTEMLIIGVVALIVIGPKDLPIVMRKLGRVVATVRRMGSEFQQEINKTTGLDQISDLRRSITEPLRQTHDEIVSEFNKVTAMGVEPSGVIKPADPKVESVYDQIAASAAPTTGPAAAAAAMSAPPPVMKPMAPISEPSPAPAEATVPVAAPKPKRTPKAKAANGTAKPAAKRVTKAPAKSASNTATVSVAAKPKTTRSRPTTAAAKAAAPEAVVSPVPAKPTRPRAKKA
ncbi:MAG: Sec-independent protein translocase protein TatB [Devosia sp.]